MLRHAQFDLELDRERAIVVARRNPDVPMHAADLVPWAQELSAHAARELPGAALVLDVREVVGNADPAFEAAVSDCHAELGKHFRLVVNLVRSAVGRMQVSRIHQATPGAPIHLITDDEAEAMRLASRPTASTPAAP